jgi:hypothetical protein
VAEDSKRSKEKRSKEKRSKEKRSKEKEGKETEVKADKQIFILVSRFFGKTANLRGRNLERVKGLELIHKGSSVVRAFEEWSEENQNNPDIKDPVYSFLQEADGVLAGNSPLQAVSKNPEVVSLTRELTALSDGQMSFIDKQRIRLSEVLKEFSAAEIISVFKIWLGDQDLSDPKNTSFLPGKFVQIADGLCYAAKKKAETAEKDAVVRAATVERIQAEAAKEREEAEKKKAQEESFDPLAGIVGESI